HELYSYTFSRLVTPERTLQGSYFRSDERMTHYLVTNSRGSFESADFGGGPSPSPSPSGTGDSIMIQQRSPAQPSRN
ncbi:MAG: LPS export ABC transporter periplasmic protein LptC, partial [Prevotellaceae bacterium]|nr:LPS export ABC transporter periplasmic protein LptC [Prevotellaceae bacterium]